MPAAVPYIATFLAGTATGALLTFKMSRVVQERWGEMLREMNEYAVDGAPDTSQDTTSIHNPQEA